MKRKAPPGMTARKDATAAGKSPDAGLLSMARMQWQFGDWDTLASMDPAELAGHSDRGPIALFIAAAHLQGGDAEAARAALEHARRWNCDRGLMLRVLMAGTHNSLARLAALRGDEGRALEHFRAAVEGVEGDARLACQARSIRELGRLDLLDQAFRSLQPPGPRSLPGLAPPVAGTSSGATLPDAAVPHAMQAPDRPVIVVAGMRHAASTALFNILRLGLERAGKTFESFYSEGPRRNLLSDPERPLLLIKTHELRDDVVAQATLIITTRRDLRDTVASARRREFPMLAKVGGVVEYAKYNRALHEIWAPRSHFEFVYEDYMARPERETARVLALAGLGGVDPSAIHSEVLDLPVDRYETTLFNTQVTDPMRVRSYADTLTESEVIRISRDHRSWLRRYAYPVDD